MAGFNDAIDKIEICFQPEDGYDFDDVGEIGDELALDMPSSFDGLGPRSDGEYFIGTFFVLDGDIWAVQSRAREIVAKHIVEV